jgi:hypothetical protein
VAELLVARRRGGSEVLAQAVDVGRQVHDAQYDATSDTSQDVTVVLRLPGEPFEDEVRRRCERVPR